MRRLYVLGLAMALLALAMPATAESIHERNVSYLWAIVGDADPSEPVAFADGRTMSLRDAIADAAARAGSFDLTALANGAAPPDGVYVGDIWILELGTGACSSTQTVIAPGVPAYVPLDPQLGLYPGNLGTMSSGNAQFTYLLAVTMKVVSFPQSWHAAGNISFYCFGFGGSYLAFPFINGIVQAA